MADTRLQRDLPQLSEKEFDLVIIGGGIFGACAAWDATLRGWSVALVEKEDYGSGTSANSFKVVHGGIRYLQHGDLIRLRGSCHERSALLRIAPHLVHPLPIVIPTYGHGKQSKGFLGAGMLLYDALTLDRNNGIGDPARHIPLTRFWGRRRTLEVFPDLPGRDLTGAAVFCDGQMYNPTRLVLAFLKSAVGRGAQMANYVETTGFLLNKNRVSGIQVRDVRGGSSFPIRARTVLNASGPWGERLLNRAFGRTVAEPGPYSRDACFVLRRKISSEFALAIQGRTHDPDALLSRPARHLFLVPWRGHTLVGVWHKVYPAGPDAVDISRDELLAFIDEINGAFPGLNISLDEVTMWNAGLVPFGENEPGNENLSYGKRSRIIDHSRADGLDQLVTLIGIRYTMGRSDAAAALDIVGRKLGRTGPRPATDHIPLDGGDFVDFERLVHEIASKGLEPVVADALAHNYGTGFDHVLEYGRHDRAMLNRLSGSTVIEAEILHAVRDESAQTLADIVFRRTDLATGGHPGDVALMRCADIAARELRWSPDQRQKEVEDVLSEFPDFQARHDWANMS